MELAGLPPQILSHPDFTEQSGYQMAIQLFSQRERPDAIFAANDLMAIGVMRAAREKGIAIPAQLAVIGFDDIPASALITPSLTTLAQFPEQLGMRAGSILMSPDPSAPPNQGSSTAMPWRLITRESA